ncbi:MAG: membrane protein insertion efficiency factor YidD [Candidatus Daviesbacteria bacterium]|nr:membrane protein insertion efficiency factor YidD [Candidatus Daviesbacteria bacterium]
MKYLLLKLIEFYQTFLSFDKGMLAVFAPGGACKNSPTCSEYTKQMINKHGIIRGIILGGKRILSCR